MILQYEMMLVVRLYNVYILLVYRPAVFYLKMSFCLIYLVYD